MSKEPMNLLKLKMSTLLWLVLFVFLVLVASIIVAGLIWHFVMNIGLIAQYEAGQSIRAFMFLLIINVLIGTILATIGGDYFLRPLNKLARATREIAKGNFDVQVEIKGSMELARLAIGFNEMAKELSSIETLRSDFVSNISHEFKTPVTSIRGFAKLLMKDNLTDEERMEYIQIIIHESDRLTRLSSNVLLLSSLESGSTITEKEEFSLDEQLRKIVLLLEPQLQNKRLITEIDLESVQISANEEMLHHVWLNILGNAIKFSHSEGLIGISLKTKNNKAIVSITDWGVGMDNTVKKRMFEKFYQADQSRAAEGNGLGLSLAKKIIDLERGEIHVKSAPGEGTCCTVSLLLMHGGTKHLPAGKEG